MPRSPTLLCQHTPTLAVFDPRGLQVRTVSFCRSAEAGPADERINRNAYDAMGRLQAQWDPRLWALHSQSAPSNVNVVYSLTQKSVYSGRSDAGERTHLFNDAQQCVQQWDSQSRLRLSVFDSSMRIKATFEEGICSARYEYADGRDEFSGHNQCGRLIRHDDSAGTQTFNEFAINGGVTSQTRRFLRDLVEPDWPLQWQEREELLEPLTRQATTTWVYNAQNDSVAQKDAKGNQQFFRYSIAGQLQSVSVQLNNQSAPQCVVSAIGYNAQNKIEQEVTGNGVTSTVQYCPASGRMIRIKAQRSSGFVLQDVHYQHDPVGNIISADDAVSSTRYFANQRVEPVNRYAYDSVYQLIEATGWESGGLNKGPFFNRFADTRAVGNYRQTYTYDASGNVLSLVHVGPQSHSQAMTIAQYSNRALPEREGVAPTEEEIAAAFDGNGNRLMLQAGQSMMWDSHNQLREVHPVARPDGNNDSELYIYGANGLRCRKVRLLQTKARTLISETRYLPGLELRTCAVTQKVVQEIRINAGRTRAWVLQCITPPEGANDPVLYCLTDHLGSDCIELDSEARIISQETYHPFGTTAWFAGRNEVECRYKTRHYSGREQDATGLVYYGLRYYAPWLMHWLNPDPLSDIDGLNLYRFVRNNPVTLLDVLGALPTDDEADVEVALEAVESSDHFYEQITYEGIDSRAADDASNSYTTEGIAQRLFDLDYQSFSGGKREFNMINTVDLESGLVSTDMTVRDGIQAVAGIFVNVYTPSKWVFKENFRESYAGQQFFANDITRHQYRLVSKAMGFLGKLPSMIIRFDVQNYRTLKETSGLENHHAQMHRVFLGNTPNGKSTARILKDFGLRATGVERKNEHGLQNFYISVVPDFFNPTLAWKSAVKRTIASRKPNGGNASRVGRS